MFGEVIWKWNALRTVFGYRGIRITVSRERETRVWTLGEAQAAGEGVNHFEPLKSIADAAV